MASDAESTTMQFAVMNLILAVLLNLICLSGLGVWVVQVCVVNDPHVLLKDPEVYEVLVVIVVALILCSVNLIFSSFLMNGVLKKNARHLKAYFVFGEFMVYCAIGLLIGNQFNSKPVPLTLHEYTTILSTCFIYSVALWFVYKTYKKYENTPEPQSPKLVITSEKEIV